MLDLDLASAASLQALGTPLILRPSVITAIKFPPTHPLKKHTTCSHLYHTLSFRTICFAIRPFRLCTAGLKIHPDFRCYLVSATSLTEQISNCTIKNNIWLCILHTQLNYFFTLGTL